MPRKAEFQIVEEKDRGEWLYRVYRDGVPCGVLGECEMGEILQARSFHFHSRSGSCIARYELRNGARYWYAYKRRGGRVIKSYLGRAHRLYVSHLEEACQRLTTVVV